MTDGRIRDRSTGELLILIITFTVCFSVLASGAAIAIVTLARPEVDVSNWISRTAGIINTLIGLLAGFLAGRTIKVNGDQRSNGGPTV